MTTASVTADELGGRPVGRIRRFTRFPNGLRSRIRYVGLVLNLLCVAMVAASFLTAPEYGVVRRVVVAAGLAFLAWWCVRGYRRQKFPTAGILLESIVLCGVVFCFGGANPLVNPLGVSWLLLRSMYGRSYDLIGVWLGLSVAILGGLVISPQVGFQDPAEAASSLPLVPNSLISAGLLGALMHWVSYAAGRFEIVVAREAALNTAALRLATAKRREEIRVACLETVANLVGKDELVEVSIDDAVMAAYDGPERRQDAPSEQNGRRLLGSARADRKQHTFEASIAGHGDAYGKVVVVTRRPMPADIQHPIESLAATCALALRTLELTEDLQHRAFHDALTGLANRDLFLQRTEIAVDRARTEGTATALVMIDLDGFKPINDQHGHAAGDAVLRAVAERLNASARADDLPARLGGDEFAIVLDVAPDMDPATYADRILRVISAPIDLGDLTVEVGASIGVAVWHGHRDADALMIDADAAMYAAKRGGKNRVSLAAVGS
ncbi:GGDEF domain-containing protein [Actinoplanes sp. NPDC049548]|uniref:GGDEF domain-containing protein n=1 Tax=Actinoplanes sp. NPDC049548 TaxID=3155152 RepID=UPI0034200B37